MDKEKENEVLRSLISDMSFRNAVKDIYITMFLKEKNLEGEFEEFMVSKQFDMNK